MRKLNLTIIAGLLAAVLGAAVVIAYGRGVDNRIADGKQRVTVLVAKQDIPAGTAAAALGGFVETTQVPRAYLVDRPVQALSDAPSATFLLGPVSKGAQLSAADFGASPAASGPVLSPAKGKVALAIQVGLTPGVAKYVSPGSTVDIFFTAGGGGSTAKGPGGASAASAAGSRTKLFASGVRVLSVSIAPPPAQQGDQQGNAQAQQQQSTGDSVLAVVEVDPQLAEKIVNATQNGSLYLALDAKGDTHTTPTGATPADVLNSNK